MHLVVHEEPGLQEVDKNLLDVIAAVDAPLSLTFSYGARSLRTLTFAPQNTTTAPSLDRAFRENTSATPFGRQLQLRLRQSMTAIAAERSLGLIR